MRGSYTAMASAHMLSLDKHALAEKAGMVQYVKRCQVSLHNHLTSFEYYCGQEKDKGRYDFTDKKRIRKSSLVGKNVPREGIMLPHPAFVSTKHLFRQ